MKRIIRQKKGPAATDLIEEATHVLRAASPTAFVCYYLGALPFVLGLVYFWADMSLNPVARGHDAEAALGLALLYGWMKFWQNVFARQICAQIAGAPPAQWSFRRASRVWLTQGAVQPFGLLLAAPPLLLAWTEKDHLMVIFGVFPPFALLLLMVGWVICTLIYSVPLAFFQNLTVLDDGEAQPLGSLLKRAGRFAAWSLRQNTTAQVLLALFAYFVFINWMSFCYLLPQLAQHLFGIESSFSRAGSSLLWNSTFLATTAGLTYLCLDPLLKTMAALRCFYGEARHSGQDLKVSLKRALGGARAIIAVVALLLVVAGVRRLQAADAPPAAPAAAPVAAPSSPPPPASPGGIPPADLDHSIANVIRQDKYAWRMPQDANADDGQNQGVIGRFITRVREMLNDWLVKVQALLRRWWGKIFSPRSAGVATSSLLSAMTFSQALLFLLIAVVVCALALFLYRFWSDHRKNPGVITTSALPSAPDLADENLGAEQLPEDGWIKLARELLERGEYRLALRAFYLSALANLAARKLISLAKFKSNRDYERELRRRGHALPQLPPTFAEMVGTFDRVWYGLHEANAELVAGFTAQADKLRRAE
jgi:hypothetical protein